MTDEQVDAARKAIFKEVYSLIGGTDWDGLPTIEHGLDIIDEMTMAARAAIEAYEAMAWRTIETAPHGQEVLLFDGGMRVGCASWGSVIGQFSNRSFDGHATHWMPLPTTLPEGSGTKSGTHATVSKRIVPYYDEATDTYGQEVHDD